MIWLALYGATILAANWAIVTLGMVPVGFGLLAPAGVYFAGLSFTMRDLTQDALGKKAVLGAIVAGTLGSAILSPQFAVASGAAFLVSEVADFAVYTPIRERGHRLWAIALSNTVGLVFDSALFLLLAFGSLEFLAGQIVGKAWVLLVSVVAVAAWRRTNH